MLIEQAPEGSNCAGDDKSKSILQMLQDASMYKVNFLCRRSSHVLRNPQSIKVSAGINIVKSGMPTFSTVVRCTALGTSMIRKMLLQPMMLRPAELVPSLWLQADMPEWTATLTLCICPLLTFLQCQNVLCRPKSSLEGVNYISSPKHTLWTKRMLMPLP